jgi:hypothetical protein
MQGFEYSTMNVFLSDKIKLSLLGTWDVSMHHQSARMLSDQRHGHRDSLKQGLSVDLTPLKRLLCISMGTLYRPVTRRDLSIWRGKLVTVCLSLRFDHSLTGKRKLMCTIEMYEWFLLGDMTIETRQNKVFQWERPRCGEYRAFL